jgi:hypothetical protein
MCPSYRATLDEQHLTRGRANTCASRFPAISGRCALASEAVHAALDLCVSCKVSARMPHRRRHGQNEESNFCIIGSEHTGSRCAIRLIARLPRWAPWAARVPWLVNLRNSMPGAALLSEKLLGFSAKRSLPAWRSDVLRERLTR